MKRRVGFTLIEILMVIGVILLLLAIAVPSYTKARAERARQECVKNLKRIVRAKDAVAARLSLADGDAVDKAEVDKELGGTPPKCPSGGTYDYGVVGADPTCTVPDHELR
ncbi:MAG: type II secretion system protein [Kiritimatiellia bacterium]